MLKFYRYLFYRFYRRQRNPEVLASLEQATQSQAARSEGRLTMASGAQIATWATWRNGSSFSWSVSMLVCRARARYDSPSEGR